MWPSIEGLLGPSFHFVEGSSRRRSVLSRFSVKFDAASFHFVYLKKEKNKMVAYGDSVLLMLFLFLLLFFFFFFVIRCAVACRSQNTIVFFFRVSPEAICMICRRHYWIQTCQNPSREIM